MDRGFWIYDSNKRIFSKYHHKRDYKTVSLKIKLPTVLLFFYKKYFIVEY
jgi:hypothetical protein